MFLSKAEVRGIKEMFDVIRGSRGAVFVKGWNKKGNVKFLLLETKFRLWFAVKFAFVPPWLCSSDKSLYIWFCGNTMCVSTYRLNFVL